MKRLNKQHITIFFFMLALIIIDFVFWLILSKQKECTPTQSHQQIIEKLDLLIKDK